MKSRAQSRTEELIRKLEQVQLSPVEVIQRALAMAEDKGDYKEMSQVSLNMLPYIAPKLQASEVMSESTVTSMSGELSADEMRAELSRIRAARALREKQDDADRA